MSIRPARWVFVLLLMGRSGLAADPGVLFQDSFDQGPDSSWTWLRESPDTWRVRDGALEIQVEPGKANSVKNALVRTAPDRSMVAYAVEVTVTFTVPPTEQYEQGGITWYHGEQPAFKLVHERVDGERWIFPGKQPAPGATVRLRLELRGEQWKAMYRLEDNSPFQLANEGRLPIAADERISIQCYEGPADAAHWIRFDDFRIEKLAEQ